MNSLLKRSVGLLILGMSLLLLLLLIMAEDITVDREIIANEKITGIKESSIEMELGAEKQLTTEKNSTAEKKITSKKNRKLMKKKIKNKLEPSSKTTGNKKSLSNCTVDSFISFRPQGRLGNKICEFIHLFHAHKVNSIDGFVHPAMWDALHSSFPNISLPKISKDCLKELKNHEVQYGDAFDVQDGNITSKMMLLGSPCNPSAVWGSRIEWQRELVFSPKLQKNANARKSKELKRWQAASNMSKAGQIELELEEMRQQSEGQAAPKMPTVIGVHVRRGDYHKLLLKYKFEDLLPPEYYQRAFQFFRERYECPLFFVITEPSVRPWCRKWMTNGTSDVVVLNDTSTPIQDLALLASMEHIIYSHGTFGLTAIMISNIKTLVYPAMNPMSKAERYGPYIALDNISKNWTSVNFVTVSATKL